MPLRQDGSGGTSSARPPTSIPPERTSHYIALEGTTGRSVYHRPARYPRSALAASVARFDGPDEYRGRSCLCSLRHEAAPPLVGGSLADTLIEIEDVRLLRDVNARGRDAPRGPAPGAGRMALPGQDGSRRSRSCAR